jgi:hypothetical protein
MKLSFEGTAEELASWVSLMTSGTALTKEMFMSALTDAMNGLKADIKAFVDQHTAVDLDLETKLADAVAKAKTAMDNLAAMQANDATTIATLQAAKDALQADVDAALAEANDIRGTIAAPVVPATPAVDPATPATPATGDAGNAPAGGSDSTSGSAGTDGSVVTTDPSMGGADTTETPVVVEPSKA